MPALPPLPPQPGSDQPPPLPASALKNDIRKRRSPWLIIGPLLGLVLIGIVIFVWLVSTCPSESQMRGALYGELGPNYKTALEWIGFGSRLIHGPHLVYHNHVIYATLDFDKGGGNEIHLASGAAGKIHLTPQVQDVKQFILGIPGIEGYLQKH